MPALSQAQQKLMALAANNPGADEPEFFVLDCDGTVTVNQIGPEIFRPPL